MTTDNTNQITAWASRWAAEAQALLATQREVEETGLLPEDPAVRNAVEDGTFERIIDAHFRQALEGSSEQFDVASRIIVDRLLAGHDLQTATQVGERFHQEAVSGNWLQQVPFGDSTCGALEGSSTLFSLGLFLDRGDAREAPYVRRPAQLEHLKALLLADHQVCNAFRIVLLPVLLGTPETSQLSTWKVAELRRKVEAWVLTNPTGHPSIEQNKVWLAELLGDMAPTKYQDVSGREVTSAQGPALMDAYSLCGLLMHSPLDPVDETAIEAYSPLTAMRFPRSQAAQVHAFLESEQAHIQDALNYGVTPQEEAELKSALDRSKTELQLLKDRYSTSLAAPTVASVGVANGGSAELHEYLAEVVSPTPPFLMVVASANGYYEAQHPAREALRYLRLRTMMNCAGVEVGLQSSAGLLGQILLDDANHQAVVHLQHPTTGMHAGMAVWPLFAWESAESFQGGLQDALAAAGVKRAPVMAPSPSSLH